MTSTWTDRHAERKPVTEQPSLCPFPICGDDGTVAMCIANGHCGCDESAAAQQVVKSETIAVQTEKVASAADPFEWHDDKPSETACNMAVTTQDGDIDTRGRPLKEGS